MLGEREGGFKPSMIDSALYGQIYSDLSPRIPTLPLNQKTPIKKPMLSKKNSNFSSSVAKKKKEIFWELAERTKLWKVGYTHKYDTNTHTSMIQKVCMKVKQKSANFFFFSGQPLLLGRGVRKWERWRE